MNVLYGRTNRFAIYQFKLKRSKFKVTGRQKAQEDGAYLPAYIIYGHQLTLERPAGC